MKKEIIKQYLNLLMKLKENFRQDLKKVEEHEKATGIDTDGIEDEFRKVRNDLMMEASKRGIIL